MCLANIPDKPPPQLYCHTCGKLVSADVAAIYCFTALHDIETGEENLFARPS